MEQLRGHAGDPDRWKKRQERTQCTTRHRYNASIYWNSKHLCAVILACGGYRLDHTQDDSWKTVQGLEYASIYTIPAS